MKIAMAAFAALLLLPASAQQNLEPQIPAIRTTTGEVLLDLIVRDKKGKPVIGLKPSDLTVFDNDVKQTLTQFRLVSGAEAIEAGGTRTTLDPLRQIRLVTLAFEAMGDAGQRKLAREAALDLVQGAQGTNVYYSVVVIHTQLLVLQPFTTDQAALTKAIGRATETLGGPTMAAESAGILEQLKRNLNQDTAVQDADLRAAAGTAAGKPVANGNDAVQAKLASVMLDMLRMDAAAAMLGTRFTLSALRALVEGQRQMPGRKSVVYFTGGMFLGTELDAPFRNLVSTANRANVTFYSVDTRGVMVASQAAEARAQLTGAARASQTTIMQTSGPVTKDQIMSSDNAETSGRAIAQQAIRNLAEHTGGFLIGDSNDLRVPLRQVNEEIGSYYELSYNPGIQNYDGSFRKLSVAANRKDLVIHSRNGYFALPAGSSSDGLQAFELPLLRILSSGKRPEDVKFRAGGLLLQPRPQSRGTDVVVLIELPLHELKTVPAAAQKGAPHLLEVHCSLLAMVKDARGEVVHKLARDRSFRVTPDQWKEGNFVEKTTVNLPAGNYTLESVVLDVPGGKAGAQHAEFMVSEPARGVGVSSLSVVRSYKPNAGTDPGDAFVFQGGAITPTLDASIRKEANAALRLFFTVYPDPSIAGKAAAEIEFLQGGKTLTKVPMQLPDPDPQGRIPYVMTIPVASIPPGSYEVHAIARQGDSVARTAATIRIE